MEEAQEKWMHRIRALAPQLQQAENDVFVAEANLKRLLAQLKLKATAEGCRTVAAQEVHAESLKVGHRTKLRKNTWPELLT
jgi:hypothetical protein